jgi:ABC-type transport system substrate-binding protein
MKGPARSLVLYGALGIAGALLILIAVQQDALEERLIEQTKATAALRETTQHMAQQLDRIQKEGVASTGTVAASAEYVDPQAKILHPEVENFLRPADVRWPAANAKLNGVLRRGWPFGDPKTLNPMLNHAAEVQELVMSYVDVSLAVRNVYTDPDKWSPEAAWRVEVTDNFREFTCYLRRGIKWHVPSGVDLDSKNHAWLQGDHELTAHDFVFALDMMTNPQVENGSLKNYYADVESWKAVDDYTFVVRWKKSLYQSTEFTIGSLLPLPKFIFAFNEDGTPIPKATLGSRFNQHWYNNRGYVGAGPYRFANYEPGVKIELDRNEGYYGDKPPIQKIIYPIYTDQNQSVLKLKSKELQAERLLRSLYRREVLEFANLPAAQRPKDNPFLNGEVQCDLIDIPGYRFIGWNSVRPLFTDQRVRAAMTHALNREGIVKDVFAGLGKVARGPFMEGSPDMDPAIKPLPFDLQKASALLDEAGWKDTNNDGLRDKAVDGRSIPFEFSLLIVAGFPEYTALATIFKEDLLKIGVKANIESAEWALFLKRMDEREFDAVFTGWALTWLNDPYQIWHSSQADAPGGSNRTGFKNKEADALIEKLRETFDPTERQKMMYQLHRIIVDSHNYTFVITEQRPFCYTKAVKGVRYAKLRPLEFTLPWSVDMN